MKFRSRLENIEDGEYIKGQGLKLHFLADKEPIVEDPERDVFSPEFKELESKIREIELVAQSFYSATSDQYYAALQGDMEKRSLAEKSATEAATAIINSREILIKASTVWSLEWKVRNIASNIAGLRFSREVSYEKPVLEVARDILLEQLEGFDTELSKGELNVTHYLSDITNISLRYPDDPEFLRALERAKTTFLKYVDLFEKNAYVAIKQCDTTLLGYSSSGLEVAMLSGGEMSNRASQIFAKLFKLSHFPEKQTKSEEYLESGMGQIIKELLRKHLAFGFAKIGHIEKIQIKGLGKNILEDILKSYSLDSSPYLSSWGDAACSLPDSRRGMHLREELLINNVKMIRSLESKKTGMVASLQEEFNLTCFGRYKEEDLIRQYEERENEGEYFPVLVALADHNGASDSQDIYTDIRLDLGERGNKLPVRFVEFEDSKEAKLMAEKLEGRYGTALVGSVSVHGRETELLTTGQGLANDLGNTFGIKELEEGELGMFRVFAPDACIVLVSCSSGAEGGFAQKLSEVGPFTVKAPEQPGSCKLLNSKALPDGGIDLFPEFRDDRYKPVASKAYKNGILVETSIPKHLY